MNFNASKMAGVRSLNRVLPVAILPLRTLSTIVLLLCTSFIFNQSSMAQANDLFWQSPQDQAVVKTSQFLLTDAGDLSASISSSDAFDSDFHTAGDVDINGYQGSHRSLALTQRLTDTSALTFEYADAREQRNFVLGFTHDNLSVSYLQGNGEDYASLAGEYAGVDPYLFHGGYKQDFSTQGFALDYGLARFGHLQYGQATVAAEGLQDRRARYLEWSNHRMFARATRFDRGADNIGSGLDVGFAFGKNASKLLALQTMQLENNRSMQRLRLQFNGQKSRQYWIDLSAHQNPLYAGNDDVRVMFSFKTLFGAQSLASYQNDAGGEVGAAADDAAIEDEAGSATNAKKKSSGWKRALFIGAGVGAAAALSSSGSGTQDVMLRFRTQTEAAFSVLNGINPRSISENREYGGWVYVNIDGSYASTTPVKGEVASVQLPNPRQAVPSGGRTTATYHTHAAFHPRFDNENFSPTDLESDRAANVDGYLATPAGQFKYHNVTTGEVSTLGTVATTGG